MFNPKISLETGYDTYTLGNVHENLPYPGKIILDSVEEISEKKVSLISLFFDKIEISSIEKIRNLLNLLFEDKCIVYRNLNYLDVVPVGCSKGDAVKFICEK